MGTLDAPALWVGEHRESQTVR